MDYAKQYQEYLARANQALEKACEIFLPEEDVYKRQLWARCRWSPARSPRT